MCCGKILVVATALIVLGWVFYLSIVGILAYVAYHFISKLW